MTPPELPITTLKAEHQVILRVIQVLMRLVERFEAGAGFERTALRQCVEFFRLFADACHHGKEEDLLFPVLESRGIPREGGPIGVMLYEHQIARQLTRDMAEALEGVEAGETSARSRFANTARQYQDLLTQHIFKEDNVLFQMGDRVMPLEEQSSLGVRFCEVNCRMFEGRRREELESMANELEEHWGRSD